MMSESQNVPSKGLYEIFYGYNEAAGGRTVETRRERVNDGEWEKRDGRTYLGAVDITIQITPEPTDGAFGLTPAGLPKFAIVE